MTSPPARRETILVAAQSLFLKNGLRGTSMEAIARVAGIAKPTLYAYFPDKGAIFSTLLEQLTASWRDEFTAALSGDGDVVHRIGAALTAKYKAAKRLIASSPHAEELYGEHDRLAGPKLRRLDGDIAMAIERELTLARATRARLLTQVLLACAYGIGHQAQSPAELGPALRLLAERLVRPELPPA